MADEEKYLKIILQYITDVNAQGGAVAGADKVRAGLKAVEDQAANSLTQMRMLRRAGMELSQVGRVVTVAGAAIAGPFIAAAKLFVDANKSTNATAQSWVAATDKVQAAYLRIGKVAAEQMLPSIQQAASLTDKLATFVEKNPGIVNAALGIGGTLTAAGAALIGAGTLIRSAANIGLLIGQLGKIPALASFFTGVGGFLTGGALAAGASVAGGVGVGALAYDQYARKNGGTNVGQFAAVGAYAAGSIFGQQTANEWFTAVAGLTKATDDNTVATLADANAKNAQPFPPGSRSGMIVRNTNLPGADQVSIHSERFAYQAKQDQERQQALPLFQQYQQALTTAAIDYGKNRDAINKQYNDASLKDQNDYYQGIWRQQRDFAQQSKQLEATYNQDRLRQLRDFNENEAKAQTAFDEAQSKNAAAHATDMARMAQDFADQQRIAASDHEGRLRDLQAAGDALGFVKEQQSYAKQQLVDKQNYDKEVQRRNQDYATQQADAKQAFDEARAQRAADFKQQQDDAKQAYDEAKAQRQQQFDQQLADEEQAYQDRKAQAALDHTDALNQLQSNYDDQKKQLKQAFTDQLNAIDPILTGMKDLVTTKMLAAQTEFAKYLDGIKDVASGGAGVCPTGYHWDSAKKACVLDDPKHPGGGGAAYGGYRGYGLHMLGEGTGSMAGREFVLNAMTTRGLENALGGQLSQGAVLNALTRGSGSVNLGGISVTGVGGKALLEQVMSEVRAELTQAFDKFGSVLEAG